MTQRMTEGHSDDLADAYANAWDDWDEDPDNVAWDQTTADGMVEL